MSDVKLGILLWSQAATWKEMLEAAKLVDRLGYAHLWTWDHVELGFRTVISEQPAPYDTETLERFIGEVVPLLGR